ncbi:unnamed protein product [Trifolium pratense]|uniref:Uncharacterized protein n=1 Tax=Trifolium pratense TaxID=57577 RepID=A0ACB0MBA2_TRIPR|nr:unnamed protein product [Trifolium pratense]
MDYSNCDDEFQQGYMEDTDFSETTKFITQILMEENFDLRPYYDPLSLQITEKSFFDALSPNQHPLHFHNSDEIISSTSSNNNSNSNSSTKPLSTSVSDGFVDLDSSITNLLAQNIFSNADSVSQFKRGFEEAKKFLPPQPQLLTSLESSNFNMVEEKENPFVLNGRKNHEREEEEEGGRNNKQSAFNVVDEDELSEMFDKVLLNLENDYLPHEKPPSTNGAKALPKKRNIKNKTIDLRNLLLLCSQAVYANDNRNANELLKQIRQHSSPFGDASERVAHYFANGLEARLVGDGARAQTFHSSPSTMRITAAEFLKAHQVHFISPPFQKFTYLFSNKMIMKVAKKAEILHIIDFGILYGFQWPMLIKYLSNREGGPPKLRITGIEFPLPGFRPTERIEETGRRLANYCKRFNVPFEYNVIASRNWEAIRVEDLKIESNEVRNTKAGFKQLPLDSELMAKLRTMFKQWYHRDFDFDEDNNWMLQGWKDSVSQFKRGFEEANKFLPPQPQLLTSLESSNFNMVSEKQNPFVLKGRKNHEREENEEERRNNKLSAIGGVVDEDELSEMFDKALLNVENDCFPNEKTPSDNGAKALPKKRNSKNETVDLRNLLLLCSQAVYANDHRNANELLKQIRQHSSPFGDASERLAHYFANRLEARLVGDGAGAKTFHSSPSTMRITAAEFLKAYQVHFMSPPFKKFAYLFANKMIMKVAKKAETLHIIDFGILYGFQWPLLIKYLSNREGGPPKLRITGIEYPLPGFRPTERIEETGRCLANYCKRFNVPFEYNVIGSRNWEAIRVEDLKIESNEVIVGKCMMRFKNLLDESIEVNSPRDEVLHLIRKINPDIFTLSVINGSYNSPFFATRFREALFHFSAIYDMLDTVMPRENELRTMIEREIMGREVMNVVACEGLERVERPVTYKLWQVRNTKAGFKQLPLDQELMAKLRTKLKQWYHRDFDFDEDNNWMLQGWKGRILYASTCWVPA